MLNHPALQSLLDGAAPWYGAAPSQLEPNTT
jgi:hypothetical protein